jgi:hypothetical protein
MRALHPRSRLVLCFLLSACASQKLQPMTVSSSNTTGYALGYPESVHEASDSFSNHKQQAYALLNKLVAEAPKPKPNEDRYLLVQVVEQADADGRREQSVQARRSERELRAFWEAERGTIGARVSGAAQKQVTDGQCENVQTQGAVNQALRDAVTRQLDKRTRKSSEAQRYLDQIKGQLSPATWNAAEQNADDITLASYLVYVALVDDVLTLQRLKNERVSVINTLQAALDRARAAQGGIANAKQAEANQKQQELLQSRIAAAHNESNNAERALQDHAAQLKHARSAYEHALSRVKAALLTPPPAPQPAAPAR